MSAPVRTAPIDDWDACDLTVLQMKSAGKTESAIARSLDVPLAAVRRILHLDALEYPDEPLGAGGGGAQTI